MRKLMSSLVVLFACSQAFATKTIDCVNQDLYWQEDDLTLNLDTMTGEYFDNNSWRKLVCSKSGRQVEKDFIFCHEKGKQNNLLTRIQPNGKAIVVYSEKQWVDFQCNLD